MEITEEMYNLAKKMVFEYEKKVGVMTPLPLLKKCKSKLQLELEKIFDENNYNKPNIDGLIMPCCRKRYVFSYDRMKHMYKNTELEYSDDGNIKYDKNSVNPSFVEYNNCKEAIRQAKNQGLDHVHWKTSISVSNEIRKEGYIDHNDGLDTISW